MKTKGISVSVLKSPGTDCSNKGLSSTKDNLIMVDQKGNGFNCPHTTDGDYLVFVKDTCCGEERLRAIPKSLIESGKWTMFGGNFVYCSDSRFPSKYPIPVHDRIENYKF
jgi:hypothetical protein